MKDTLVKVNDIVPLLTVHQSDLFYSILIESQYLQRSLVYQPTGSCQHLRAVIILDVHRRRSICSWFEYLGGSAAIFFAYFFFVFALFRSSRLVSIEDDRRLEGSSAQHANVYLRSRRIHVWNIWRHIQGMPTQYTHGRDVQVGVQELDICIFNFCILQCGGYSL